jgi:hypothetical protein
MSGRLLLIRLPRAAVPIASNSHSDIRAAGRAPVCQTAPPHAADPATRGASADPRSLHHRATGSPSGGSRMGMPVAMLGQARKNARMWVLDPANSPDLVAALKERSRGKDYEVVWVGEGWRGLVDECHKALVADFPEYELLAVKQKFGVLAYQAFPRPWVEGERGWTQDEAASVNTITEMAQSKSQSVCEWCGAEGWLRDNRSVWLTLCNACEDRFPDPPYVVG